MIRSLGVRLAIGLAISVQFGCSHVGREPQGAAGPTSAVSFAFTSNRHLELEPCGCTFENFGGVEREFNALESWRKKSDRATLVFSAGTTFAPFDGYNPTRKDLLRTKAGYLVEAMNALGLAALSPSANDFAQGSEAMRDLEKKAKFPFVSSNLYLRATKQPLFKTSTVLDARGTRVLVLGLSAAASGKYPISGDIEVRAPEAVLGDLLAGAATRADVVVLLTSLPKEQNDKLVRRFPQVNVVFGGTSEESNTFAAAPLAAATLHANSLPRGRGVFFLDLETPKPLSGFFNEGYHRALATERDQVAVDLEGLKKSKAKKSGNVEKIRSLEARLALLNTFPQKSGPGVATYESSSQPLTASFATPTNSVGELVKRYKKATREIALDSLESEEGD